MCLDSRIQVLAEIRRATDQQVAEHGRLLHLRDERDAGRLIECLDDGFVCLVDHMGDDAAICQAARISYGKGTRSISDDRNLIRYLMRHRHTTPFEMTEWKFHIRIPMDHWRQMIRHRTASVNEYSTRYSEAIDSAQRVTEWRLQSTTNKQGSEASELRWPEGYRIDPAGKGEDFSAVLDPEGQVATMTGDGNCTPGQYLSARESELQRRCRETYVERLRFGVAREQARKDLPLSTYTEAIWKIDGHNLLHFLELRMDSHSQVEIWTYANSIAKLIQPIIPTTWEAFQDYRLGAIVLSLPEVEEINQQHHPHGGLCSTRLSERERRELAVKLDRLGIKATWEGSEKSTTGG